MNRRGVGVLGVLLGVVMPVWVPGGSSAAAAPPTLTVTLREDPAQPHFVSDAGRAFVVDVTSAGGRRRT